MISSAPMPLEHNWMPMASASIPLYGLHSWIQSLYFESHLWCLYFSGWQVLTGHTPDKQLFRPSPNPLFSLHCPSQPLAPRPPGGSFQKSSSYLSVHLPPLSPPYFAPRPVECTSPVFISIIICHECGSDYCLIGFVESTLPSSIYFSINHSESTSINPNLTSSVSWLKVFSSLQYLSYPSVKAHLPLPSPQSLPFSHTVSLVLPGRRKAVPTSWPLHCPGTEKCLPSSPTKPGSFHLRLTVTGSRKSPSLQSSKAGKEPFP